MYFPFLASLATPALSGYTLLHTSPDKTCKDNVLGMHPGAGSIVHETKNSLSLTLSYSGSWGLGWLLHS
jgi:hypothetical protein